jgi:hypothetical protein
MSYSGSRSSPAPKPRVRSARADPAVLSESAGRRRPDLGRLARAEDGSRSMTAGAAVAAKRARIASGLYWTRLVLALAALSLPLTAAAQLDERFQLPGGVDVFIADVVVGLAVCAWLLGRIVLPRDESPRGLGTPLLGWPLLVFLAAILPGIIRAHDRFGASLVGQPSRLVLYAGIAAAFVGLRPRDLYRGITAVFYAGAVWEAALGCYHLATGTSQTPISSLSTGGTRALALTTAMYLAGAFFLALLHLARERRPRWQAAHMAIAALAAFGIVLSFGRTTFVALAVVLPVLFWQLRGLRAHLRRSWKPAVAVVAVAIAVAAVAVPDLGPTLRDRITANPLTDESVRWRMRAIGAALSGLRGAEQDSAQTTAQPAVSNAVPNGSFENGLSGWRINGAAARLIASGNPNFGSKTLVLSTTGDAPKEGLESGLVPARVGQTWSFGAWLRGREGSERVSLAVLAYDQEGRLLERTAFPVAVTVAPTRFVVNATLAEPDTRWIRVAIESYVAVPVEVLVDTVTLERVTRDGRQNFLADGDFELGTENWNMQGGTFGLAPQNAVYGRRSLRFTTDGVSADQGPYSPRVEARAGEAWTFSIWLAGERGGERVNVAIWEYDSSKRGLGQVNVGATLTAEPKRYSVSAVVQGDVATAKYIRALVRTPLGARPVTVYADGAQLERGDPPAPFAPLDEQGEPLVPDPPERGPIQADELIFGSGFGRPSKYLFEGRVYRVEGDPDNSYVYLLAGGGIVALGAFLALLAVYAHDALRRLRRSASYDRDLVTWALATWFVFMVNCLMAPFLPRPKLVLTIWALMLVPAVVGLAFARDDFAGSPGPGPRAPLGFSILGKRRRNRGANTGPLRRERRGERQD